MAAASRKVLRLRSRTRCAQDDRKRKLALTLVETRLIQTIYALQDAGSPETSGKPYLALTPLIVAGKLYRMSLAQLKDQAAHLQLVEQRELIAFLIARQTKQDEEFKSVLTQKVDDPQRARWVELDELQSHFVSQ